MMNLKPFNSKIRPAAFPHHFDAHIYFQPEQLKDIEGLRDYLSMTFQNKDVFIGNIIEAPIGPHPDCMLEINFSRAMFAEVVLFLMGNRKELNVLIHPNSGDDLYDHTQGAMWLGQSLQLKLEKFETK